MRTKKDQMLNHLEEINKKMSEMNQSLKMMQKHQILIEERIIKNRLEKDWDKSFHNPSFDKAKKEREEDWKFLGFDYE